MALVIFDGCKHGSLCERCVDEIHGIWRQGLKHVQCNANPRGDASLAKVINIVVCSWNSDGLFCSGIFKLKAKLKHVENLMRCGTVIGFQETHDDDKGASLHLTQLYSNSFVFERSFLSGAAGGVMIAIRKSYLELFEWMRPVELIPSRMLAIELQASTMNPLFICVHVHTNPTGIAQKMAWWRSSRNSSGTRLAV